MAVMVYLKYPNFIISQTPFSIVSETLQSSSTMHLLDSFPRTYHCILSLKKDLEKKNKKRVYESLTSALINNQAHRDPKAALL